MKSMQEDMNIRKFIEKIYSIAGYFIAPGLKEVQDHYKDVLQGLITGGSVWLDVGCGRRLFKRKEEEPTIISRSRLVIGVDYNLESLKKHRSIKLRIQSDAYILPFKNNSFDYITANMFIEHAKNPGDIFQEVFRALKPGALFILHTTNLFNYGILAAKIFPDTLKRRIVTSLDGRKDEDIFPAYYKANTPRKIRFLAQSARFHIVDIKMVESAVLPRILLPLSLLDLLIVRISRWNMLRYCRPNIIAILEKPKAGHPLFAHSGDTS